MRTILNLLIPLILLGCVASNSVRVIEFSPSGVVKSQTTFRIEFSKQLAPIDKQGKWLTDEFIKFEPAIPGQYKWLSSSVLIFAPDIALAPMQSYKAKITDKVLFDTEYYPDFQVIEFKTPDFELETLDIYWSNIAGKDYYLNIQAEIVFTYPVNPENLLKNLTIRLNNQEIENFNLLTKQPSTKVSLLISEIKQMDKTQKVEFIINKELATIIGNNKLKETSSITKELPPITELEITGVAAGFDGYMGWIEIKTTQPLDESKIQQFVFLEPVRDYKFYTNENILHLDCDLTEDRAIKVIIKNGLTGLYGGKLKNDYEETVFLTDLEPSIYFADRTGKYLMLGGNHNIEVNTVNVDEIEIEVAKIFKNNLALFLHSDQYYYDWDDDFYYNSYIYTSRYGKSIFRKNVNLNSSKNWLEKYTLNLDSAIKFQSKGIYVINITSANDLWISSSKILAISDIALIAKRTEDELYVFANSIKDAEPLSNVEVNLISRNNQILATGKTDRTGLAYFTDLKDKLQDFELTLITAETDNDFNFLNLNETQIETSRFDISGLNELSPNYSAFIYSDRNLYRPGDKAYLSAIIRKTNFNIPEEFPVLTKIISPTGKALEEFKHILNEQGSFELVYNIPEFAQTGEYTFEIYTINDKVIGTYKFSVEEFVPDKIRVFLKQESTKYYTGDILSFDIESEFLFGSKAAGLRYEATLLFRVKPFTSEKYKDFDFASGLTANKYYEQVYFDGFLDYEGKSQVNFKIPEIWDEPGIIKAIAFVSVFDLTGRSVNRSIEFDIYSRNKFLGIKSNGYYYSTNQPIKFNLLVLSDKNKPLNQQKINISLVRYEWRTVLRKRWDDRYFYSSEEKEIIEWTKDIVINDIGEIKFTVEKSGRYQLRASLPEFDDYQKVEFYAYSFATSTLTSFNVNKEGKVEITPDKKSYKPGELAKILFTCPFSGKLLITIERNGVYDYKYLNVINNSAELQLNIKDEYLPNVYISATLFKKHEPERTTPFFVGHGIASINVEKPTNKLPLKIISSKQIKPNSNLSVTIETLPERNIFLTLSAVDEGILQIKNFETPDPYKFMYSKRALKVYSYDIYKFLLPEIISQGASPGGGDEYDLMDEYRKKALNPIPARRFQLLAYWSGIRKTGKDGKVTLQIPIPQFNGEIRLMAVAYQNEKFGSAENFVKVYDDLIIEPQIPRFLTIGDELVCPVTVINTTSKQINAKVEMKIDGALKLETEKSQNIKINPNSTAQATYKIRASKTPGNGKIIITCNGQFTDTTEISIRPASPYITESGSGSIKGNSEIEIKFGSDFLFGSEKTLVLSRFPAIINAKLLKNLIGYPYGCVEQTISRLFPQLYYAELAKQISPEHFKANPPVYYIKEGIKKIESMQLYDGGIAFWEGGLQSNWWASCYAAHFLIESKKAGYNVSEKVLNRLLTYLNKLAKQKSETTYIYYENGKRKTSIIPAKEIFYSLYVQSLAGKSDISTMNYHRARLNSLSNDSKYLLAASFAHSGKWATFYDIIPSTYIPEKPERTSNGSFDSELRANALMLNVLIDNDPSNKQIPFIIKHISNLIKSAYSTQEMAWAFLALGKAAKKASNEKISVEVLIDGKVITSSDGKDISLSNDKLNGKKVQIRSKGNGEMYYFWSARGIKKGTQIKEEDSFVKIRREYIDYRTGQKLINTFYQGQLVLCNIKITGSSRSSENIAISDLIPAGFEIDNPRLTMLSSMLGSKINQMNIDYFDIRDDRLIIFTNLQANTSKDYYYLLRVVNQGEYRLPPISAEAMYTPEIRSINGAGIIKILPMQEHNL